MMVDVGGATTDVYSFNENKPYPGARLMGVSEPYAKRTVEGDMGMRESSICILREVGDKALASGAGVTAEQIEQGVQTRITTTGYLPDTPDEQRIDQELAGQAVGVSVRRHAGHVEHVWTTGSKQYQVGKNISEVSEIIGIGGVIVNSPDPAAILQRSTLRAGVGGRAHPTRAECAYRPRLCVLRGGSPARLRRGDGHGPDEGQHSINRNTAVQDRAVRR